MCQELGGDTRYSLKELQGEKDERLTKFPELQEANGKRILSILYNFL